MALKLHQLRKSDLITDLRCLTEGRIRILHVTGTETPVTSFLRIFNKEE